MQAISIRQPEAWLIVNGHKDIENRSIRTHKRGYVAVHASAKHMTREDWKWLRETCALNDTPAPDESEILYGGVIGVVEIVDCVTASASRWFFGRFGFMIRNARPLPFRPCRGMLGFFTPDVSPPAPKAAASAKPAPRQGGLFP